MKILGKNKKGKPTCNKFNPAQILAIGFASVILVGTLLLMHPAATVNQEMSFIDALFTATSAVCVTGLVVVDTGTHFTIFGQLVILILIQIGGLGFMTVATLFAFFVGKRITLKERLLLQEALNQLSISGIVRLTKYIIIFTFSIELTGAFILALNWSSSLGWNKAFFYGVFHSVSAFNNAGFDLMGNFSSLTNYTSDFVVNITVMTLIILGGIGFFVLVDVFNQKRFRTLTLHSKLVIKTSSILIFLGFIIIFLLEFTNISTLGQLKISEKVLASFFQSVTTRTAGFNTIDTSALRMSTKFLMIILMFIGASPGSTGGGIKTTTFACLFISVINTFKNNCHDTVFERTLNKEVIRKAIAVAFVSTCLVLISTLSLTISEKSDFLTLLFEATSAFGTVGLSLGITPFLTLSGKITIIFTMFAGRVGPLTLVFALAQRQNARPSIKYVEEKVTIG